MKKIKMFLPTGTSEKLCLASFSTAVTRPSSVWKTNVGVFTKSNRSHSSNIQLRTAFSIRYATTTFFFFIHHQLVKLGFPLQVVIEFMPFVGVKGKAFDFTQVYTILVDSKMNSFKCANCKICCDSDMQILASCHPPIFFWAFRQSWPKIEHRRGIGKVCLLRYLPFSRSFHALIKSADNFNSCSV